VDGDRIAIADIEAFVAVFAVEIATTGYAENGDVDPSLDRLFLQPWRSTLPALHLIKNRRWAAGQVRREIVVATEPDLFPGPDQPLDLLRAEHPPLLLRSMNRGNFFGCRSTGGRT